MEGMWLVLLLSVGVALFEVFHKEGTIWRYIDE